MKRNARLDVSQPDEKMTALDSPLNFLLHDNVFFKSDHC